jgi:MFS family permease
LRPKTVVLMLVALASFLAGAIGQYHWPGRMQPPSDLWFLAVFALLGLAWYRLDSDQRSYRRTPLLSVAVIAVAAIALPYYFFRSRGAKRGLMALGAFVLVVLASGLLTIAGGYFAYYVLQD